ncbi:MAG: NERD domain-containing protein [Chthoniobacterales bacterium]|nr:NERD domain-containing protein [Chthoniobacterales bacterium]
MAVATLTMFLLLGLLSWRKKLAYQDTKLPFTKRGLRPPGESLRVKLEEFDDKMTEAILWLMGITVLFGISVYQALTNSWLAGSVFIALMLAAMIWWALHFEKRAELRRDHYLGFLGERAVGEELNQLLAKGWSVFHDVEFHDNPGAKPFNVDHVVVGTGGLFAIETKTRRKRKDKGGHEVTFNGQRLVYPWGEEDWGIKNARERAKHLGAWLSKELATPIIAKPVLALPGWMVHRRGASDLRVVSGSEVTKAFSGEESNQRIEPQTVQAIKALLDQKCRDVEA